MKMTNKPIVALMTMGVGFVMTTSCIDNGAEEKLRAENVHLREEVERLSQFKKNLSLVPVLQQTGPIEGVNHPFNMLLLNVVENDVEVLEVKIDDAQVDPSEWNVKLDSFWQGTFINIEAMNPGQFEIEVMARIKSLNDTMRFTHPLIIPE